MPIGSAELTKLITDCLSDFHARRLAKLKKLKLHDILKRKNPYLYKAMGTENAAELVERILRAYMSSSDETIFGDAVFEPIARVVSGGATSPSGGVDVVIETETGYLAISVKSGPNPFNSSQKKKQHQQFSELRSRLQKTKKHFDALLGYCYGQRCAPSSSTQIYREAAGEVFWNELTGDSDFYLKLIRQMEEKVIKQHKAEYLNEWQMAVNRYVRDFTNAFCARDGSIDWEKLTKFSSSAKCPSTKLKAAKKKPTLSKAS